MPSPSDAQHPLRYFSTGKSLLCLIESRHPTNVGTPPRQLPPYPLHLLTLLASRPISWKRHPPCLPLPIPRQPLDLRITLPASSLSRPSPERESVRERERFMGSLSISIFVYLTLIVLFLLLLLSPSPDGPRRLPHRRLKLRSHSLKPRRHVATPFDPLVADLERRREDRAWEREHFALPPAPGHEGQPEWEDSLDAEDYLNDEDRFNITHRLVVLFPRIDLDPADGFLSVEELTEWNLRQAEKEVMHRTSRDMELHDKNRDGFVSLQEYEPPTWAYHSDDGNSSEGDLGWWKADHFNASDMDGDGLLNSTEFNDFLHPADSNNPKLIAWLCKEEIRERDKDKDRKLNFQEFFHGLFDSLRDYDDAHGSHESDSSADAPARKLFSQLDKDNDGFLSAEELKAVIGNLHPSEHYYAKQQAEHTISEADKDKDGRLSLKEMIDNPYVFYSAIFSDDEDDYLYHDELR